MEPRTSEAIVVRLGGRTGLVRDILTHHLRAHGGHVVEREMADRLVTVLVDPSEEDWAEPRSGSSPVVFVAGHELSDREVVDAVMSGADGIVEPDMSPEEMVEVVAVVVRGGCPLRPRHAQALAEALRAERRRRQPGLTGRETEIMASIARGEGIKQTARALGISSKTVENLQSRLFRKLEARNRAHALARARMLGLGGVS